MKSYKSSKLNKILIIIVIILLIIAIIGVIIYFVIKKNMEKGDYEDRVTAKHYFSRMTIDLNSKEVKRDEKETTLKEEFEISDSEENNILTSEDTIKSYFQDSTFEVEIKDGIAYITNKYQTKKIILEVKELKGQFNAQDVQEIQEGMYILTYDTQKRAREAFEELSLLEWVKNIETDEVFIVDTINDESQTVYGEENEQTGDSKAYGIGAMGLDNYKNIIDSNGNPSEVTVATIGYGACVDNEYFGGRISEKSYNFIEDTNSIYETTPQGSRILEVIQESTTHNVKLMPLMIVDGEGYTTLSSIIEAISYATNNSDVICYELVNEEDYMINLALEKSFKENIPVCCITTSEVDETKNYPANNSKTIAVSSLNKENTITDFSGRGKYLDFSAYSTDVEEIFNTSSSVSRWSGAHYSNAHIVSAIALIKTYHKDYRIIEIYDMLKKYCVDLGTEGKDEEYGLGCPNFKELKISDIDTTSPQILEISYNNNDWEKAKNIQIKAKDEIRAYGWAITQSDKEPTKWETQDVLSTDLDVTGTVEKNGSYYIWAKDSADNVVNQSIEINKIDNTAPEIQTTIDDSKISSEKYVTIKVTAVDNESGLNQTAYSWDGTNWSSDSTELKVTENGKYTVYVRDALENVSKKDIKINKFPQEGVAKIEDGSLIKSVEVSSNWSGDKNNSVKVIFKENLKIVGWKITTSADTPDTFNNVNNSDANNNQTDENTVNTINNTTTNQTTNTTRSSRENEVQGYANLTVTVSLEVNKKYYAWIKDSEGNVGVQEFSISKASV